METLTALRAICAGNSPVPGEFPTQRLETRSFDVYFDLRPNKRLSKQTWGWWFETPSRPLWRHRNDNECTSIGCNFNYSATIKSWQRAALYMRTFVENTVCWKCNCVMVDNFSQWSTILKWPVLNWYMRITKLVLMKLIILQKSILKNHNFIYVTCISIANYSKPIKPQRVTDMIVCLIIMNVFLWYFRRSWNTDTMYKSAQTTGHISTSREIWFGSQHSRGSPRNGSILVAVISQAS